MRLLAKAVRVPVRVSGGGFGRATSRSFRYVSRIKLKVQLSPALPAAHYQNNNCVNEVGKAAVAVPFNLFGPPYSTLQPHNLP
jgi:hypothetical protein